MFLGNTKDLKKGEALRPRGRKPKPSASSQGSSTSSEIGGAAKEAGGSGIDVVSQATQAREERARQRDLCAHAVKIQALVRGFVCRRKSHTKWRDMFDSRMADLVKLSNLLTSRGVDFSPPPAVVMDLYGFLFTGLNCRAITKEIARAKEGAKAVDDIKRVVIFCKYVLNPSLAQKDATKNCVPLLCPAISVGLNVKMAKLLKGLFHCLSANSIKHASLTEDEIDSSLLQSVRLLSGGAPCAELQASFRQLRQTLMEKSLAFGGETFFSAARKLTLSYTAPFMRTAEESDSQEAGGWLRRRLFHSEIIVTEVFAACAGFLTESGVDTASSDRRLEHFFRTLLGCPMLTLLLSTQAKVSFCSSPHFPALLKMSHRPLLGSTPYDSVSGAGATASAFEAGHWLEGNILHLGPSLKVTATVSSKGLDLVDEVSDDSLCLYLDTCAHLMALYHLPFVFHGRETVLWTRRERSNLMATGMPLGLQEQLGGLVSRQFMLDLYQRVLVPVREDVTLYPGEGPKGLKRLGEDAREVQESLKKDGKSIASASLEEEKEQATWFTGKWASKVMRKFNRAMGLSSAEDKGSITASEATAAAATAAAAAAAAGATKEGGKSDGLYSSLPETEFRESPRLILSLVRLWSCVLPQVAQPASGTRGASGGGSATANNKTAAAILRNVSVLIFQTRLTDRLWVVVLKYGAGKEGLKSASNAFAAHIQSTGIGGIADVGTTSGSGSHGTGTPSHQLLFGALTCFVSALRLCLSALDDEELYVFGRPLPLSQLLGAIRAVKTMLYSILTVDPTILTESGAGAGAGVGGGKEPGGGPSSSSSSSGSGAGQAFLESQRQFSAQFCYFAAKNMNAVMRDLHSMWSRRAFSRADLWTVEAAAEGTRMQAALREDFFTRNSVPRALLFHLPGAVSFHERMRLFRDLVDAERLQIQGDPNPNSGARRPSIVFQVRRRSLLEDGMKAMEKITGANIKMRIQIQYINEYGEAEAGIDIGGLFKDFVTELSDRIFDPNYGLFCMTAENLLYPNPAAAQLYEEQELAGLFSFLGRVLGKALYENITLQPQFAHFFLAFMHGRYNFQHLFSDLVTLDPELHRNLLFLKKYEGDVADLALTFSVNDGSLGGNREQVLVPGGDQIDVTSANRHQYINAVAKHYLHDRLRAQAGAFFHGLYQALDRDLLGMFSAPELQILISGASTGINVEDLKGHCRYNGYSSLDRTITNFWAVFDEMSERDRALVVKFVTSCERPPSLGFSSLDPPFSIQRGVVDDSRLPTASTCFNVLKLPVYSSKRALQDKLLTAIRSNSGFELS